MLCEHSIQSIAHEGMHRGLVLGGQDLNLRSHCGFYMNGEREPWLSRRRAWVGCGACDARALCPAS